MTSDEAMQIDDSQLTNYEWVTKAILTTETKERLDMLARDIAIDRDAKCDYTSDAGQLATIRRIWKMKHDELTKLKKKGKNGIL